MATLSQAAGPKARSLEELEAAGVCAATFPSVALFAAAQGARNVLRLLKRGNSLAPCQEHFIPLDDYYELVGLKPLLAREESYDQAAAALVRKRAAEHATRVQCCRTRRSPRFVSSSPSRSAPRGRRGAKLRANRRRNSTRTSRSE